MKPKKTAPTKLENNWRSKTLENLEKDYWEKPEYCSHLVTRCHALRKVVIDEFTTEDLRLMIGQNMGLPYLMVKAIEILNGDLFTEGDLYPGNLLKQVIEVELAFWKDHKNLWTEVNDLIKDRRDEMKEKIQRLDLAQFDSTL